MAKTYPLFLAGKWQQSETKLEVINPYDGGIVGDTFYASPSQVETAIATAEEAFPVTRKLPAHRRGQLLANIAQGLNDRREEVAKTLCLESGKPIRDATSEVERGLLTLQTAAEEAKRLVGEVIPLDLTAYAEGRLGIAKRFPIGPIAAITPFNFPLNLALHKIAPAIAVGNPVILKPPSKTPLTMLTVAEIAAQSGLPPGALSILPMATSVAEPLISDERLKMISFTGSAAVGWGLKAKAGKKRVLLELGGNAGVIVDKGANLDYALKRITVGSFSYAGQICISVQRIYVHREIWDDFFPAFIKEVERLKLGDPLDPETDLGPMIEEAAAKRTEAWVSEAVAEGAQVVTGGKAQGSFFQPTVLVNASPQSKVCSEEVFAPVVTVFPFTAFKEAVREINSSHYGLQAGVFTPSLENAFYAFEELEVGGVIINDIPNFRVDHMPYGGTKNSGLGREGLRYAIEEMTEIKLMALKTA
ncbi:MAG: aldehyde dehydrogenase family protein [Chloroflexi bacterium]|nr:aldehyde dehydrogenase family protein [Chloroflexota bacterium]